MKKLILPVLLLTLIIGCRDDKIFADPIQFPDKIGWETVRAIV